MLNGWISIIKEKNFTSNFYINFLKKILKKNKLGHAGTLDPFAEGVLPIAIGEATKSVSFFQTSTKIYYFEMIWGEETDTLDCDLLRRVYYLLQLVKQQSLYPFFRHLLKFIILK